MSEKSVLLEKDETKLIPNYSDVEGQYIGRILNRLLNAKVNRDKQHPEFNNQTLLQWYSENERIANTVIVRDRTNKDFTVNSGTVEQKLYTVAAEINRLNLSGQVRVFEKEDQELYALGTALTDICDKTNEIEGDEENKLIRQVELLKQGTIFIQDNWVREYKRDKVLNKKFTGDVTDVTWETKLEKVFDGPKRQILYMPGVYLGNIREFDMKKQPYIFTHKITSYEEAKSRYGMQGADGKDLWGRWQYVPKARVTLVSSDSMPNIQVNQGFSLTDLSVDMVEEIHYQDRFNNEYQIFLNGIPQLPIGFPLSAITPGGEYNIEKQVLQTINPFFAYGRSFVVKTQQLSDLLDEMLRLLILKTRKSIHPPYANVSGKVISERSLMPGAITMNIDPNALVPIGKEGEGATSSEYQMLNILKTAIDNATVSPQLAGQAGKSGTTAYEVQLLQQQAQKLIALVVFACSQLEKKITWLRLNYVLERYFEPIGTKIDDVRGELVNIYRNTSRKTTIDGRGAGVRQIIPIEKNDGTINPESVYNLEEYHNTPAPMKGAVRGYTREELGMEPVQKIFLDLSILRTCKYIFYIEVEAKPKDTSTNAKLMFREELRDIQGLMMMGSRPNVQELQKTYALLWGRRPERLFAAPAPLPTPPPPTNGAQVLNANPPGGSTVPAPEAA